MEKEVTFQQALNDAIAEEMTRDPTIFCMGEDIRRRPALWGSKPLEDMFDNRILNSPISEQFLAGGGLRLLTGMRPIIQIGFVDFSTLMMDQFINHIGKARYMSGGQIKVPFIFVAPEGSSGGSAAQHSQSFEGFYVHIMGIKVAVPSTPYDVKGLFKTALRGYDPVVFLPHKKLNAAKGLVPEGDYTVPFGKGVIRRSGKDVTIVTWLYTQTLALAAAQKLEEENISVEIIDPRTLVPLDLPLILDSVKKTGRLVIAEEECKRGAAASEVAAEIAEQGFKYLKAPIKRLAAPNVPIPYAKVMEDFVLPKVEDIVKAVKDIM